MTKTAVAWSGGKDCAWSLRYTTATHLITTYDESTSQVPIHNVRIGQIRQQAQALQLSLIEVPLPPNCNNATYIERFSKACQPFEAIVFGDLFLEDIRRFRELSFPNHKLLFPLWNLDTTELAYRMIQAGLDATVTAAGDPKLIGRKYDRAFLQSLPPEMDPCGENGEFHTWVEPKCLESFR